ncbi:MAG: hypothetical protein ABSH28_06565 [Acidobacteriota bacterium]|jgi:hypothetical protein
MALPPQFADGHAETGAAFYDVGWGSDVTDRHLRCSEMHKKKGKALFLSSLGPLEDAVRAAGYGRLASSNNASLYQLQGSGQTSQTNYKSK